MVNRRAYRRVKVNSIDKQSLYLSLENHRSVVLGLDVAKLEIVACLRLDNGEFERPWSVSNPAEIVELVQICQDIREQGLHIRVALESTGTYADGLRMAMDKAQFEVIRVGGNRIGEKAITKRGPSAVRRWVYFWAMRSVQREELREWYYRFHHQQFGHSDRPSSHRKMKGLVAMMRKLMKSLWSSMHKDEAFTSVPASCDTSCSC